MRRSAPARAESPGSCSPRASRWRWSAAPSGLGLAYATSARSSPTRRTACRALSEIGIDPLVLLFTLAISLVDGLLFGVDYPC